MSDLAAFLIGAGAGLLITVAVLYRKRDEVAGAWRQRGPALPGGKALSPRRVTIAVHALAALGFAYLAVAASDSAVRAISLFVCLVAIASIGALLLQSRRSA